jgi:hypothetical protein
MGANRSGKRRTQRLKRAKRHDERLARKSTQNAAGQPAQKPAAGEKGS